MKKRDYILIATILIFASILVIIMHFTKREGSRVVVSVDGEVEMVLSLKEDGDYSLNNGSNVLRIEDGYAFIIEANCPDKKCMHEFGDHGKIHNVGEVITCLPNKLTVKIVDEDYVV